MNIYDFVVKDMDGNDVPLSRYKGKTLLIVNTATACFCTPQYKELEKLYDEMKERDFEILDFPCAQFGNQIQDNAQEIHSFCEINYRISFKQFASVDVNGENAEPLFKYLKEQIKFGGFGLGLNALKAGYAYNTFIKKTSLDRSGDIRWNFTKFLVDKNGEVVARFESVEPIESIRGEVNRLLNGEELSIKYRYHRKAKDSRSEATNEILRQRRRGFILFFVLSYLAMFLLDLSIMQSNGIEVFQEGVIPREFTVQITDEEMRQAMELVNEARKEQHPQGFWDRIFMNPDIIRKQLLLPLPAVLFLSIAFEIAGRRNLKNVNRLCAALEQASAGNFNYRLKTSEKDIFYRPFKDFNHMSRELKETVCNLEEAVCEAKSASEAKSNFLSNMSHEIRTPLNAVLGMDEMIIRESKEESIVKYAVDIQNAGKILLSLINDILDFSKIEANKLSIIPVEYDLSSIINDLMNMVSEKAKAKNLELSVEVDDQMPHLYKGDEIRIKQVCLNIINNAIKYTAEGSVKIKFDGAQKEGKPAIRFTCIDTGQGIKVEDIPKLTEPFARINEKDNRTIEGTGLGMSITTSLLDMMNSRLEVESEFGSGSTFSFVIEQPVVSDEPIGDFAEAYRRRLELQEKYVESFHASEARVMVVDDVEMNLTVITSLLKTTLIQIDTCTSGRAALEKADENKYDVILVDHMMPDMDGIETMKAIRQGGGPNADTPIVVLTANAVSGARERYMQEGFDGYLTKPIESIKLERMLQKLLPDEKIEKVYVTLEDRAEVEPADDAAKEKLEKLGQLPKVDTAEGIKNSGGIKTYLSVVENFANTAEQRINAIDEYYRNEDLSNYTIQVHGLKSSARLVGQIELSELAKLLEASGNSKDMETIARRTEELLSEYKLLADQISGIYNADDDDLPPIDKAMLTDGIQTIYEALQVFDMDMADSVMEELDKYSMPEEFKETYRQIKILMSNVDRDAIMSLIDDSRESWR